MSTRRRIAIAAGLLLVAGLALAWALRGLQARHAARNAAPRSEGALAVDGLEAPVRILRDGRGLPHVLADGAEDALFGLGFVHAQDRLGQMLWLRRQAQGRSAESLGRAGVEADRMARLIGFARLAESQLPRLPREVRGALEAYAAGVNARLARVRAGEVAPPRVVTLGALELEDWRPADSLAVLKLYAWGLGASVDASLVLSDLIQRLGADGAQRFFPGEGLATQPVPDATVRADPDAGAAGRLAGDRSRAPADPASALRRQLGLRTASVGSSAWILGAPHSASGRPMLAVDHHLPATAPAWLHLDHVRGGDLDVIGATLPGLPVFWSGHNGHVAWASVHAGAVVTDVYVETLDPDDPTRFHDGRRWRPLEERVETIRVRGDDDVVLLVRSTRHGPLLPAVEGREPLSVSWTGARESGASGIGSLLRVARARDSGELRRALASHHEPVIAVVHADVRGAGGLQVAGWIPRRSLSPQLLPLPGRAAWYAWSERVPFDELPARALEEDTDWIVAADAPWSRGASDPVDWLWRPGIRAERIAVLLAGRSARGPLDLRTLSSLQADVGSTRHRRIIDAIETLAQQDPAALGPQAQEFLALLRDWDGVAAADSRGAAAYHVLLRPLAASLVGAPIGTELWERYVALPQSDLESLLADVLVDAASDVLAGDARAEAVRRVVRESLREAWLQLSFRLGANVQRWTWGALHTLRFSSFSGLAPRGALAGPGPFPYGGSTHTVQAAAYDPLDPFETEVASTLRLAFDTDALDQGLAAVAPGQSEHPGHPHFADQVESWRRGRSSLLPTGTLLVEETSVSRLVLEPVR